MTSAGGVLLEFGAVADHRAFEVLFEQLQTLDQGMDGVQHRPRDIVGINRIATDHQQCRMFVCVWLGLQRHVDQMNKGLGTHRNVSALIRTSGRDWRSSGSGKDAMGLSSSAKALTGRPTVAHGEI